MTTINKNKKPMLELVPIDELKEVCAIIDGYYTKVKLEEICLSLPRHCENGEPLPVANGPEKKVFLSIQQEYAKAKNAKKSVYVEYAAIFLASSHNFAIYLDNLSEKERKVWSDFHFTKFFRYDRNVDYELHSLCANWFTEFFNTEDFDTYAYSLNSEVYNLLQPLLIDYFGFPDLIFVREDELKASDDFTFYSNVDCIDSQFFIMDRLMKQDHTMTPRQTINNFSQVKSIAKKLQFPFPIADGEPNLAINKTAAAFFINTYICAKSPIIRGSSGKPVYEALRSAMIRLFGRSEAIHELYLPHLVKQTARLRDTANSSIFMDELASAVRATMKRGMDDWYDVESIVAWLLTTIRPSAALFYHPLAYERYYRLVKRRDKNYVTIDEAVDQVVTPLVKAFLLMCATMGLCELALQPTLADDTNSYVEPVRFVRFNAMARYVFGLDNEMPKMESAESNMADDFKLSDDHLVIHVCRDSRYSGILVDYAKRLTPTLWGASHTTFMSNCQSVADMKQKIESFKKSICPEPPQNWLDFFNELPSRFNVMEKAKDDFTVFNVPKDRTDIQRLLLTDDVLSKLVVRAEGYLVLVHTRDLMKFNKRFTDLGYTLG